MRPALERAVNAAVFGIDEQHAPRLAIDAIMCSERPDLGLESLNRSGLLSQLFPSVTNIVGFGGGDEGHKALWPHTKQVVLQAPRDRTLRLAALYHDVGKPKAFKRTGSQVSFHGHEVMSARAWRDDCSRLPNVFPDQVENDRIDRLIFMLGQVEAYEPVWSDTALVRLHEQAGDNWNDLCLLAKADVTSMKRGRRDQVAQQVDAMDERLKTVLAAIQRKAALKLPKGVALVLARELGIEPGPKLGQLVKMLEQDVAEGRMPVMPDPESYAQWARIRR